MSSLWSPENRGKIMWTVRAILPVLAALPLARRGHGDVVAVGQLRQRRVRGMNLLTRQWRRSGLGVYLAHWICSCLNDSITPRRRSRARNRDQLRTGI